MQHLPASIASLLRHGLAARGCSGIMQSSLSMRRCPEAVCLGASCIECAASQPAAEAVSLASFQSPQTMPASSCGFASAFLGSPMRGFHSAATVSMVHMGCCAPWPGGSSTAAAATAAAASLMPSRQLATAAAKAAVPQQTAQQQKAPPRQQEGISEVTAVKVVKYLVIGMIIVLTVRIMPYMGMGTVESALQLLSAESPFLQKAGAQRLSAIAALSDAGALSAIEGEAIPKLLDVLKRSRDRGTNRQVVQALLRLARVPEGELAMVLAEAPLIMMLVIDTGDVDEETVSNMRELMSQLEAAAERQK